VDKLVAELTESHGQVVSTQDWYSGVTKFILRSGEHLSCLRFVVAVS
jgi:hypothetical protein